MKHHLETRSARQTLLLGTGLALAFGMGMLNSSCIVPDECILVTTVGQDWCRDLQGAKMWPAGHPESKQAVGTVKSCSCFNAAEKEILAYQVPAAQYAAMVADLEQLVRNECDSQVPQGYDHNCYITSGSGAPTVTVAYNDGPGMCVGDCIYTDNCGDPNPYECECILEGGCSGQGTGETGGSGDTGGGLDAGSYISCVRNSCDVDADFAQMLWDDPSLLMTESTRLVYDATVGRFVFDSVGSGSVADELGLQTGDVLESVDSVVIDDLDSAMQVFVSSGGATSLDVRVLRGTQWVDLTFSFI